MESIVHNADDMKASLMTNLSLSEEAADAIMSASVNYVKVRVVDLCHGNI